MGLSKRGAFSVTSDFVYVFVFGKSTHALSTSIKNCFLRISKEKYVYHPKVCKYIFYEIWYAIVQPLNWKDEMPYQKQFQKL